MHGPGSLVHDSERFNQARIITRSEPVRPGGTLEPATKLLCLPDGVKSRLKMLTCSRVNCAY